MRPHPRLLALVMFLALGVLLAAGVTWRVRGAPGRAMAAAAVKFMDTLPPDVRAKAVLAFDGPERQDWHFVPRQRPGLAFKEMTDPQRIAARNLLRTALSSQGMLKVESIMALDTVLFDMERAAGGDGASRDALNYSISIFGSPTDSKPWGWRIEGHHLCLNFTSPTSELTAVTPAFLGSNPAEVRQGGKAGVRVLAVEEDLGRELVTSLTPEQRLEAVISKDAPADVLSMPGRSLDAAIPDPPAGLLVSKMNAEQRVLVEELLAEFAGNLRRELAEQELGRIRKAGIEQIRFAWAGGVQPGQGHYYRLVGPTFVIEYDNTQNNANHVHTIWHDRQHDLGRDMLKEHYQQDHDGHGR